MIFKSIKLRNFRQFKGDHHYNFSDLSDGSITLFIAENGVGKTTFFQAFRFCFYGNLKNNKYLNLPKPEELINDTLINTLEDNDIAETYVEIKFEHKGIDYLMRRQFDYMKQNTKMVKIEEKSTLSYSTNTQGYKTLEGTEADLEMNKILPAGLSHIFMFDGERMEREIGSREFRDELKESILGILNIKKYDSLIQHLGDTNKSTSVIGRVYSQISHTDLETAEAKKKYDDLKDNLDIREERLEDLNHKIKEIEKELQKYRAIQRDIDLDREKLATIKGIELNLEILDRDRKEAINTVIKLGFELLLYKELLRVKEPFDNFVAEALETRNFYQYLHINTIEDIIDNKVCLCGTSVLPGSFEENRLNELKKSALPEANVQNVSFIQSDIFSKASNYKQLLVIIKEKKDDLNRINAKIQREIAEHRRLSDEIIENEKRYGENHQENVDRLQLERDELIEQRVKYKNEIDYLSRAFKQQENIVMPMLEKNKKNEVISKAVKDLSSIKNDLIIKQKELEEKARYVLSKHFNEEISQVMSGSYSTEILPDYTIRIIDKDKQLDVTEVLSTGQNVIISISFIKSLIMTAKELSEEYDHDAQYGVITDAALSNLDEKHIQAISKYNLTQLDQLIFLSFKRQLRDEMYESIKNDVGKAYSLTKENNQVISYQLNSEELYDYIHRLEEDEIE